MIEVGYIRDYSLHRVDFPDGSFCLQFYKGSFTIKNLPTPFVVKDYYPPIEVNFFNGTGADQYVGDVFMFGAKVDM